MNVSTLLLPALLALSAPAYAQCGGGHSGHGGGQSGHGSHAKAQDHSGHQESGQKVKATNTICPVMGREVKPGRDREVVIRENQYLVCCDGCGPEMSEHYDKYFDKGGRPLNDPKRDPRSDPKTEPKVDSKPEPKVDSKKDADKPVPAPPAHEGHQH